MNNTRSLTHLYNRTSNKQSCKVFDYFGKDTVALCVSFNLREDVLEESRK